LPGNRKEINECSIRHCFVAPGLDSADARPAMLKTYSA